MNKNVFLRYQLVASAACIGLAMFGCGGALNTVNLGDLRSRGRNGSAADTWAWAEAELLGSGGESAAMTEAAALAAERNPEDERAQLLFALERELHGDDVAAVIASVRAIELANASGRTIASATAEVAVARLEDLSDGIAEFAAHVEPLEAVFLAPTVGLGAAARHGLGELLIELAFRRGDLARVASLRTSLGCVSAFRVAGPFGPRVLLGLDEPAAPDSDAELAEAYDLGPSRGRRDTRVADALGCTVHLGGGPLALGGTSYAEATVEVARAGEYFVRVETPNSYRLRANGQEVAVVDRRAQALARVMFHRVTLAAGSNRIRVKLSTPHPSPVLLLAVVDGAGRAVNDAHADAATTAAFFASEQRETSTVFASALFGLVDLARFAAVAVREQFLGVEADEQASPLMLTYYCAALLSDPLLGSDVARDRARTLLTRAKERDANAWYPRLQLARMDNDAGQRRPALVQLRELRAQFPHSLTIAMFLRELEEGQGLEAAALRTLAGLRRDFSFSCRPLRLALEQAIVRNRASEQDQLTQDLVHCDARSDARMQLLLRQRRFDEARTEFTRLMTFEPPSRRAQVANAELTLARASADNISTQRLLAELEAAMPRSEEVAIMRADNWLSRGQRDQAQYVLRHAVDHEAQVALRRIERGVFSANPMERYRKDGRAVLEAYRASGRSYREPKVLVLDYTVTRMFADGSMLQLTHQITQVQTEDAADEEGQYSPPENAEMLTLRTIKADGARLEPDPINGLSHIEMPSLQPGDFVEQEYMQAFPPSAMYPGATVSPFRFFFASYETPFDFSELRVVVPADVEPVFVARGAAPEAVLTRENTDDGPVRTYAFTAHQVHALSPEPASVSMREFMPSIYWGYRAEWSQYAETLHELLVDKNVVDPAHQRLLVEIGHGASERETAERIYNWVQANIEPSDATFAQAATMVNARTGHPLRVLHYLLLLAGVRTDLAMVRDFASDPLSSDVPDDATFAHLLVRANLDGQDVWIHAGQRGLPFGIVPPILRGGDGILLDGSVAHVTVDNVAADDEVRVIDVDVALEGSGRAQFVVRETYRGWGAAIWREQLRQIPPADLERQFGQGYVARLAAGAEMRTLNIRNREDVHEPLLIEYTFEVASWGRTGPSSRFLPGAFLSQAAGSLASVATRTTTMLVGSAIALDVHMRIRGAAPLSTGLAMNENLAGPGDAHFTYRRNMDGDTIVVERQVRIPRMRVAVSDYAAFAQFCRSLDELEALEVAVRN